ncbi:DGQHR domain-containing protein [Enterococcus hulanensis]|uniref:DGQHR domain-containing protein n=1 Tax=Enterococcus hulanensis TaxID=2559929 RepID=UPI001A8CAE2A|nr:DGQHR domain-containing protein [Enterococcus hulanensis]MBO0455695.1 DGQHR domain-containing protein [Enterococcus hulanensis]
MESNEEIIIISDKELSSKKRLMNQEYDFHSVKHDNVEEYTENGWEIARKFKTVTKLKKMKPEKEIFINRIWRLFHDLGFDRMNEAPFKIANTNVDVLAIDDETVMFVFCRFSEHAQTRTSLLEDIKQICDNKKYFINYVQGLADGKKRKCAFILITKNLILNDQDVAYMEKKLVHFNEEGIKYYEELAKHLGSASRFQLLGYLFSGQKIPEMDNKIPAIEGRMGNHKYYSFSIEPEKLLKMGYVLHRNNANRQMMPTYQRIVKRSRLNSIQKFVEDGGFFPNSLIINIENKSINFDYSEKQVSGAVSKIGILHLPKLYRSAYIIDGQHRLYGYANSDFAKKNSIPVVAFVNLGKSEQIKLFMDINENQKAVPKNLRATLSSDILWASEYLFERKTALRSRIAQNLAEDLDSPLYQRIIVGENATTEKCNITLDTIQQALDKSDFLDQYAKKNNELINEGTLDTGSNDETAIILLKFLKSIFLYFEYNLKTEWNEIDRSKAFLVTNPGIYSLIKITNDIVNFLIAEKEYNFKNMNNEEIVETIKPYLDVIIKFYKNVDEQERTKIKKTYGSGGKQLYWRTLQREIKKVYPDFSPKGLDEYWKDNDTRFNEITYSYIMRIELFMRDDFKKRLMSKYGEDWFNLGLPKKVYDKATQLAADKDFGKPKEQATDPWTCLHFIHFREIALENWKDLFSDNYTLPEEKGRNGKKTEKTKWMVRLSTIRNENSHVYTSVKEEDYKFVEKIYNWLVKG